MATTRGTDQQKSLHEWADQHYLSYHGAAFSAASTRSEVADLDGRAPIRIVVPGTYSATQGQTLRVQLSADGSTFYPLWKTATAYTVKVQPAQVVAVDPTSFWGVRYIRLHSTEPRGTASTQHASLVTLVARVI